ncbi:MAG TPA: cysteine--tRNA ligase [bacterium]|jgi:cysteinyl-tRNA synthetase|nr:cysteine--tRNA ligase [bacterium]
MRLYNTLTRNEDEFIPRKRKMARMYVCGVTPYDYCHVGHGRSYLIYDVLYRFLRSEGFSVLWIQNFTDIDDKIINRANELNIPPKELADRFISEYFVDMDRFGISRAFLYPRVTEHIDEIVEFISKVVEKGYAYESEGDVYFSVRDYPSYGKLSRRSLEEMIAGARVDPSEKKKDPMDFALWKSAKPGEPYWDSPWGRGRPGWHIECSVMSLLYLGEEIDIHGGGADLIFPHHENELAQSEAVVGDGKFVRFWTHNGLVNLRSEKMSKSTGNFIILREILNSYRPEAFRLYLLGTHYRSPLDFDPQALEDAQRAYTRIEDTLKLLSHIPDPPSPAYDQAFWDFRDALSNDLNTPQAIGTLFSYIRENRPLLDKGNWDPTLPIFKFNLIRMCEILGFKIEEKTSPDLESDKLREVMDIIIKIRNKLREEKLFHLSDEIRDSLNSIGVILEDMKEGTRWKMS